MDEQQLLELKPEMERFLERYAPLFGRPENQAHARLFVQGLFHKGERRNAENIAESIAGCNVRNLQAFISSSAWDGAPILAQMRRDLLLALADPDAVWNSDETSFPKKGTKSVGVKRQYSGTTGHVDNCQVGVFANYCSVKGHTMMDRRLYLPEEWANDAERRAEAGVPKSVVFRTKPELALEMMSEASACGVPFRWVGGDSVYGDNLAFVRGTRQLGKWYVLDVASDTTAWTEEPKVLAAEERPRPARGRRPSKPEVVTPSRRVDEVIAALPASAWKRVAVGEGSQGQRRDEYAEVWVQFKEGDLPGPRERLLARRSIGQDQEVKYHRSNAPAEVALEKLAQVRALRWTIEEDIQSAKGECGLDEYETRGWVGWHHHTALSLLALAFLLLQKVRLGEKRGSDERAGGAVAAAPPGGGPPLGHGRDPALVGLAPPAQPPRCCQPPQAPLGGTNLARCGPAPQPRSAA